MHQSEEPFEQMIAIVAAMTNDYIIGIEGRLPWSIQEDLKNFKRITDGHTVVMGRKTFESLPNGPLKNRYNIVVSRTLKSNQVHVVKSITEALFLAPLNKHVFIIGGEKIYEEALEFSNVMYLTVVHDQYVGDAFFPKFDERKWAAVEILEGKECTFMTLQRVYEEESSSE